MKALARYVVLLGCVIAGGGACSGPGPAGLSPSAAAPSRVTPVSSSLSASASASASASVPVPVPAEKGAASLAADYYRAIAARNYPLAFTYLASDATGPGGGKLQWQAFIQFAHMMDDAEGPVVSFSVGAFQSLVVMTIERKKSGPYHAHLRVARGDRGWTIISIDRI